MSGGDPYGQLEVPFEPLTALAIIVAAALVAGAGVAAGIGLGLRVWERRHLTQSARVTTSS